MANTKELNLKVLALEALKDAIQYKIDIAEQMLQEFLEAVANDTKSTAGDKHETATAMAQIEQEKAAKQKAQAKKMKSLIQNISTDTALQVELGAIVYTKSNCFYISQAIGKIAIKEQTLYCVSPSAPIVQAMLNLKAGDTFTFNGITQEIEKIY